MVGGWTGWGLGWGGVGDGVCRWGSGEVDERERESEKGSVRIIFSRADQPVKKYILTEFKISCCCMDRQFRHSWGICHTLWHMVYFAAARLARHLGTGCPSECDRKV